MLHLNNDLSVSFSLCSLPLPVQGAVHQPSEGNEAVAHHRPDRDQRGDRGAPHPVVSRRAATLLRYYARFARLNFTVRYCTLPWMLRNWRLNNHLLNKRTRVETVRRDNRTINGEERINNSAENITLENSFLHYVIFGLAHCICFHHVCF